MAHALRNTGRYVAGLSFAGLAALVFGFGLVHLLVAVPQAVFPIAAGVLLFGTSVATMPASRRAVERRTGWSITDRRVALSLVGAVLLCALYAIVSFILV